MEFACVLHMKIKICLALGDNRGLITQYLGLLSIVACDIVCDMLLAASHLMSKMNVRI